MSKTKRRGIVLVTTLMIVGFLVMLAAAMIVSTRRQSLVSGNFYYRESAASAAEAGINYAMMRLNQDPYWTGCTRDPDIGIGSAYSLSLDSGKKLEVLEHQINGNMGAIEGKINDGNNGYFELYFVKPSDAAAAGKMSFFGTEQELSKMPVPSNIAICNNRNNQFTPAGLAEDDYSTWAKYSDDSNYKPVPDNSILLVCRGTMGGQHRTVEVCVRMGAGADLNSVAIGRGNVSITVNGDKGKKDKIKGKIKLDSAQKSKPPIIRANQNIFLGNTRHSSADYLDIKDDGGGRAAGSITFDNTPKKNKDTFLGDQTIQDNAFPALTWDHIVPDTSTFGELKAGYYKVEPGEKKDLPKVTYYPSDSKLDVESGTVTAVDDGSDSLTTLVQSGKVKWDEKTNKLTINESIDIDGLIPKHDPLKNLLITGPDDEHLKVELNSTYDNKSGEVNTVYFVNNIEDGNVAIEGSMSGTGTVIVKGNLYMMAESKFTASEETGISLYAMGDININAIEHVPKDVGTEQPLTAGEIAFLTSIQNWLEDNYPDEQTITFNELSGPPASWTLGVITDEKWELLEQVGLATTLPGDGYREFQKNNNEVQVAVISDIKFITPEMVDAEGEEVKPKDSIFKGLIFACKNFLVNIPDDKFTLVGGLVAYGGIPGGALTEGTGNITINAREAKFTYDTKYLSILQSLSSSKVEKLYWATY
ncbi:MAG: hypothetical protein K8T10_11230 [Candidatus Eremiobacteraeota bacterium]|nr:hypothetical protein [Candidatus Eremiobacteraeota bacterium]